MLARWPGLAALAAAVLTASGCGGLSASATTEATGSQLAVYSSLPLQGPLAADAQQIVGGEKLALAQAGGQVGPFKVGYVSLDDADPANGQPSPGAAEANAKTAAQDPSAIAYLGDFNSAETAVSLPLINASGILQVSPGSPYVGLTSSLDAGQDEPARFYLTGRRTFGRLQPGDPVQAQAQVELMRSLGVRSVYVIDDQSPFEVPLATIAASDATHAGITLAAHDSIATPPGATFTGEVQKVLASGAQAVLFVGGGGLGTVALWHELHGADARLQLLGTSSMLGREFTSRLGASGAVTYLTSPVLAPALYPPAAQRVLAQYRRSFAGEAGPYVLYGYEAMSVTLAAIRGSGARGNDRRTVIAHFFATSNRDSVLGHYSMRPDGETTLSRYGVDRVRGGLAVFERAVEVSVPGASGAG